MARRQKRSNKPRRDPNQPQRGKNAYQSFVADHRDQLKVTKNERISKFFIRFVQKSHPDANPREILKKLGEMWRESDENVS